MNVLRVTDHWMLMATGLATSLFYTYMQCGLLHRLYERRIVMFIMNSAF